MKIILTIFLFVPALAFSQMSIFDTFKKGADIIQNLNSGNNQETKKPEVKTETSTSKIKKVEGPPVAKSGTNVTNQNIKEVLTKFNKDYEFNWKTEDDLTVLVNVEITKNGAEKFYKFNITNRAQVPKDYSMISITCDIPQHFEQAIEQLKTPPKTIVLTTVDWRTGITDTESSMAGRAPVFYLEALCDFKLANK